MAKSLEIKIDASEMKVLIGEVKMFRRNALREIEGDVENVANQYMDMVIRRAQGRPGPRKITGGYIESIMVVTERSSFIREGFSKSVVSDHPAARRLELGFIGIDSMGRHYNQSPFPHWGPAMDEAAELWEELYKDVPEKWWP